MEHRRSHFDAHRLYRRTVQAAAAHPNCSIFSDYKNACNLFGNHRSEEDRDPGARSNGLCDSGSPAEEQRSFLYRGHRDDAAIFGLPWRTGRRPSQAYRREGAINLALDR
jgi:hypothetical protein